MIPVPIGQIILMILRSQNQRQRIPPSRQQPVSIRDIMRQHDLSGHLENNNTNNILPPSLTNPDYQTSNILSNLLQTHAPPSHIQSEPSIQLPDPSQFMMRERSPRRRKIFQDRPKNIPKFQPAQNTPNNNSKFNEPTSSFGTTPQFTQMHSASTFRKEEPIRPLYESFSSPPQNSSGTVYNTIPSIKKTTDNKNETVYEEMNSNFGMQPSGISLRSKQSTNRMSDAKPNSSFNRPPSPKQPNPQLNRLSRNVSLNPPLPVYESKFYQNEKPKGEQVLHSLFEKVPIGNVVNSYQPHYTNVSGPRQNQLFDAMAKGYQNFEAKQTPSRFPSFGNIPNTSRPMSSTEPILMHYQSAPPQRHYQKISAHPNQKLASMSPFEYSRKEQTQMIPKRFEEIENKVLKHETELIQLNQKLAEAQLNDLEAQKALLNELIKKEQQLNLKQKEINSNLERITKMQVDSDLKKEQILKYELQIQQARRVEDLHKENERLYHELIRKDRSTPPTDDFNQNYEGKKYFQKSAYRTPIIEDQNFNQLLSPFSIKPDLY